MITLRTVGRQAKVFGQGERVNKVYVLRRGWLQATHLMPNGKAITDLFGPGSLFGIDSAAAQSDYPYTAVAIEDCELEEADSVEFLSKLQDDPDLAMDVLRHVSRDKHRLLSRFFATVSKVRSSDRLLETLEEISYNCSSSDDNGCVRISLPLPVQVLADHIGCSRQWVSKMLAGLEEQGTLQRQGVWITLGPRRHLNRTTPVHKIDQV